MINLSIALAAAAAYLTIGLMTSKIYRSARSINYVYTVYGKSNGMPYINEGKLIFLWPVYCCRALLAVKKSKPYLWKPWNGGACPVPEDHLVEVKMRGGWTCILTEPASKCWFHADQLDDISKIPNLSDYDVVMYRDLGPVEEKR